MTVSGRRVGRCPGHGGLRRGSCLTTCGSGSHRCCRSGSEGSGTRAANLSPDRQVLCGILFVLHTGIQWERFPQELGFGSGMTCWRRLRDWNEAGVWQQPHEVLLAELNAAARLDWSRAVVNLPVLGGVKPPLPANSGTSGPTDTRSCSTLVSHLVPAWPKPSKDSMPQEQPESTCQRSPARSDDSSCSSRKTSPAAPPACSEPPHCVSRSKASGPRARVLR